MIDQNQSSKTASSFNPWTYFGLDSDNENHLDGEPDPILPCSGKVLEISQLGKVTLKYNREVRLTGEFSNKTVSIYIVPVDPSDQGNYNLTWELVSIESDEIGIQLKFSSISTSQKT